MDSSVVVMQRLTALEDLMRRSEGNTSHILTRLKDVEVALTHISKAQEKAGPELRYLYDELNGVKRQVTTVDQSWRQTYSDFSGSLQNEIRSRIPQQIDVLQQQVRQETAVAKAEVQEMGQVLRRVSDQWTAESHDTRQVLQTSVWKLDQMQNALTQLQQQHAALERRVDTGSHDLRGFATEVERNAGSFRQFIETAVRAAHGDLMQRLEGEQRARDALQQDVQATLQRIRDDLVRGLAHSSATCKVLEENTAALETVLRAEVRSRIQKSDEIAQQLNELAEDLKDSQAATAEVIDEIQESIGHNGLKSAASLSPSVPSKSSRGRGGEVGGSSGEDISSDIERILKPELEKLVAEMEAVKDRVAKVATAKSSPRGPPPEPVTDPTLVLLDMEEDPPSDDDDPVALRDPMKMISRVHRLSEKIRLKANLKQVIQLKDALYHSMRKHMQVGFTEMAERLQKDQKVLEGILHGIKEQLQAIEGKYSRQQAQLDGLGRSTGGNAPPASADGDASTPRGAGRSEIPPEEDGREAKTLSQRVVTRTVSSTQQRQAPAATAGASDTSAEMTPRSRKSSLTTTPRDGAAVKHSRPPSENPNVMKQL